MAEAVIRLRYTELADVYIQMFGAVAHVNAEDLRFLKWNLSRCEGAVLDAGCGPGHLTAYLTDLGLKAKGIDLVPAFINNARSNWPEIDFAIGSVQTLDIPDSSLSGILAWYSLIHFEPATLATVFAEFRRAMSHDGKLVVGFFEGSEFEPFDHKVTTAYRWPADEMAHMLSTAGFVETDRLRRLGTADVRPRAAIAAFAK